MNERALRVSSWVRGILIAYGVAAFSWFFSWALPSESLDDAGGGLSAIAIGLTVQILLLCARLLLKRRERERGVGEETFTQAMYLFELLADAVTVLLFALGTYRAIFAAMPAL